MPATDDDIARFTSDGVVLTKTNKPTLETDANAIDGGTGERILFFDDEAAGQKMVDELFAFVGAIGRAHEAIEIGDGLALGSDVPLWPAPQARVTDESRGLRAVCAIRAYSFDMTVDAYAIELVGIPLELQLLTWDNTEITFDATDVTFDREHFGPSQP